MEINNPGLRPAWQLRIMADRQNLAVLHRQFGNQWLGGIHGSDGSIDQYQIRSILKNANSTPSVVMT
ncbi:hypothetical protein [Arthrobacter sp. R4-81]